MCVLYFGVIHGYFLYILLSLLNFIFGFVFSVGGYPEAVRGGDAKDRIEHGSRSMAGSGSVVCMIVVEER